MEGSRSMRSKLKWVLALLPALLVDCTSQREHTDVVCEELARCTLGQPITKCDESLGNAIEDYRLSRSGLVQCSRCLEHQSDHSSQCAACNDILVERHCDVACGEVQMVLNARTTVHHRANACAEFQRECGNVAGAWEACRDDLRDALLGDPTFTVDLQISACLSCISAPSLDACTNPDDSSAAGGSSSSSAGGSSALGGGGAGGVPELPDDALVTCPPLLARCAEPCRLVPEISERFATATAAISICQRNVKGCLGSGLGGAHGQSPPPDEVDSAECYAELVEDKTDPKDADDVAHVDLMKKCAECDAKNPDCGDLVEVCGDCRALYGLQ
jgi:hypothetical protein